MDIERLLSLIPIGKDNAIHQSDLGKALGVSPAAAKGMIREARNQGHNEILSGIQGYYIAADDNERREFVSLLSKQAATRFKTVKPVKSTLNEIEGQMSLSDTFSEASEEVAGNE